jgi:hypothetical protein
VGNANRIDPAFLVEEKVNCLIFGDLIKDEKIPSPELRIWVDKFSELCKKNQLVINYTSCYYVTSTNIDLKTFWLNFLRENNFYQTIFPPILQLKMEQGGMTLEKNVLKLVKDYSNEFIEFLIDNKNGGI